VSSGVPLDGDEFAWQPLATVVAETLWVVLYFSIFLGFYLQI
jgi:hypothetical protein